MREPRRVLDAAVGQAYRRLGKAYVPAVLGFGWILALALTAAGYEALGRYWGATRIEINLVAFVGVAMSCVALIASAAAGGRSLQIAHAWTGGHKDASAAPATWVAAHDLTREFVSRSALFMWAANTGVLVWAAYWLDVGWSTAAVATGLGWGNVATGWVIELFAVEVAARPVLHELSEALDHDPPPLKKVRRLETKFMMATPVAAYFGAYLTGAALIGIDQPTQRLSVVLAALAIVIVVFVLPIVVLANGSILDPVRDLVAGTRRVAVGDYTQLVPPVTNDDLGSLARNFNAMQSGLQQRQRLHSAIESYIDPAVADRIAAYGAAIPAKDAEVTVMFIDIVGFTTRSEGITAEEVVRGLNYYFELVVPIVRRHGGHPNKLMGDGLMAVFGIPDPLADHAAKAYVAAREIVARIAAEYGDSLRVGIGMNSGSVVVGTMGDPSKLDYTIIGDAVNVASRVESQTRRTGDDILITEDTMTLLNAAIQASLQPRGEVTLRGRSTTTKLFAARLAD